MALIMRYSAIRTRIDGTVLFLQLYRPEARNAINSLLVEECAAVLDEYSEAVNVVVVEGLPEVFSIGADFQEVLASSGRQRGGPDAENLYNLWCKLSDGAFVSVAHARGKILAGGVGFVAACDVVIGNISAQFSLSEMLFGLYPACVMPFLARRVGLQRSRTMTLTAQTISAEVAQTWGLVDACDGDSDKLITRYLARIKLINKDVIRRYKDYARFVGTNLSSCKERALAENRLMFSNPEHMAAISRYLESGLMPWEVRRT